jgi:phospholipid/cholesterol/gamma-HCH transport system substrate-binding protein
MKQNLIETIVGFLVILIAGWFFLHVYKVSDSAKPQDGYSVRAEFENIEGLTVGSDVKLSGIKIGYIDAIKLENEHFLADVSFRIKNGVLIPKDSRISVSTSGLLGGKYARITPGADDNMMKQGDKFLYTQSALNIEDLISKIVYAVTSK